MTEGLSRLGDDRQKDTKLESKRDCLGRLRKKKNTGNPLKGEFILPDIKNARGAILFSAFKPRHRRQGKYLGRRSFYLFIYQKL